MTSGAWSRRGNELSGKTANYRTQQVCDFLAWMHWKGHRRPFNVPYSEKQVSRSTRADADVKVSKTVRIRKGQSDKSFNKPLILPEEEEVRQWAEAVYQTQGQTIGLICETILCSALRREEVVCLRVDTLPLDRRDWVITNPEEPADKQLVMLTTDRISHDEREPYLNGRIDIPAVVLYADNDRMRTRRSFTINLQI